MKMKYTLLIKYTWEYQRMDRETGVILHEKNVFAEVHHWFTDMCCMNSIWVIKWFDWDEYSRGGGGGGGGGHSFIEGGR